MKMSSGKESSHKTKYTFTKFRRESPYLFMILPGFIMVLIFSYIPMGGIVIAFQKFIPAKGLFGDQTWIGLDNFRFVFALPGFRQAFVNTVIIAAGKIVTGLLVPVSIALMLNEVRSTKLRGSVQTMVYLPYFLSWVILGGVLIDLLSPNSGIVNKLLGVFGIAPKFFLGSNDLFRPTLIVTNV